MILRIAKAAALPALASLVAVPAQADVLEIGAGGEALWIAGPRSAEPVSAPLAEPLAEVPADVALMADYATSHAGLAAQGVPAAYAAKVAELSARFDLSPALIEAT
jgi:hypothetical protein